MLVCNCHSNHIINEIKTFPIRKTFAISRLVFVRIFHKYQTVQNKDQAAISVYSDLDLYYLQ